MPTHANGPAADRAVYDDDTKVTALEAFRRGFTPVKIPTGAKAPAKRGWQNTKYGDESEVAEMFAHESNIGLLLGDGLADVDLDCAAARAAAPMLLPSTPMRHGRPSAPESHRWYLTVGELYVKHLAPDGSTIVELRAKKGHQTNIPPTVHPSGELLRWEGQPFGGVDGPAKIELAVLRARVAGIALVALLAEVWPDAGSRHDAYLALVGGLLRGAAHSAELVEITETIVSALADVTGDEQAAVRVAESVPSTRENLLTGEKNVTGWTTLGQLLVTEDPGPVTKQARKFADKLRSALGIVPMASRRGLESHGDGLTRVGSGDDKARVPSPDEPMRVARHLLPEWTQDEISTLHRWRGGWMVWRRSHWAEVEDASIRAEVYRALEHAEYLRATKSGSESVPWAPTRHKIANVLDALGAITHLPDEINPPARIGTRAGPMFAHAHARGEIVACSNGLLDVQTRELHAHSAEWFNLVSVPFAYDAQAPVPARWLQFLAELWGDDLEQIDALQEFFGYVISGRTDLHKILLIVGPTRSGKGTIARILTALIGKDNVAGPTLDSLRTNFGLAPLLGKPLAVVSDARLGGRETSAVVERLLTISGEDYLTVDRKYREQWTGKLPTRFLIMSNELPHFGDASGVIAKRFIVLTMTASWLGREDHALTDKLLTELPGILNWALDGLAEIEKRGRLTEPASSAEAVLTMEDHASPVSAFVRDWCERGPAYETEVDAIWRAWLGWCAENGREHPGTRQRFARDLRSVIPQIKVMQPRNKDGSRPRIRIYSGVALRSYTNNGLVCVPARASGADPDHRPVSDGTLARDGTRTDPLLVHASDESALVIDNHPRPRHQSGTNRAPVRDDHGRTAR